MLSIRCAALMLALAGAALPLYAASPAPDEASQAANVAKIRAEFAAKDATIADLRQQITQLQKQAPATAPPTALPLPSVSPSPPASTPSVTPPAPETAVHFSVDKPASPVTAVLAALSKQVGVPILADDTVEGTLGVMAIDQPGLEATLDQVTKAVPGLAWQKVYLPLNAPLPKGDDLSELVREVKKPLTVTTLTLPDPATKNLVSLDRKKLAAASAVPAGMQTVYLMTNETIRAQRLATQSLPAPAASQDAAGQGVVNQAVTGLQSASDMLGQMTPDQQRQALPLMFQQFSQMIKNIDPTVRQQLFQQFRQFGP